MSENGGFVNCRLLTMPDLLGELAPDMEYIVRAGWVPSGQGKLISKNFSQLQQLVFFPCIVLTISFTPLYIE